APDCTTSSSSPVPLDDFAYTSRMAFRSDEKAIRFPSGDHAAFISSAGSKVSRELVPRARSIIQIYPAYRSRDRPGPPPLSVWGKRRIAVLRRFSNRTQSFPLPIEPHQGRDLLFCGSICHQPRHGCGEAAEARPKCERWCPDLRRERNGFTLQTTGLPVEPLRHQGRAAHKGQIAGRNEHGIEIRRQHARSVVPIERGYIDASVLNA